MVRNVETNRVVAMDTALCHALAIGAHTLWISGEICAAMRVVPVTIWCAGLPLGEQALFLRGSVRRLTHCSSMERSAGLT